MEELPQPWSRGSSLHPQEKGPEGGFGCPPRVGSQVGGLLECDFFALSPSFCVGAQIGGLLELLLGIQHQTESFTHSVSNLSDGITPSRQLAPLVPLIKF
jgi:hypothetical protein